MNKGKNRAAAAVELAAVLLATAAAFAWGQRDALSGAPMRNKTG